MPTRTSAVVAALACGVLGAFAPRGKGSELRSANQGETSPFIVKGVKFENVNKMLIFCFVLIKKVYQFSKCIKNKQLELKILCKI